jgi:hypothetical protein
MTPRCPTCHTEMPDVAVYNQTHTCSCGCKYLVIRDHNGRLKWWFYEMVEVD